jgi:hypothetical protein
VSRENFIVSMDGQTDAFLGLKAWLLSRLQPAFDAAMLEGRKTFAGANRYWADLVHAGAQFAFESANSLVQITQ